MKWDPPPDPPVSSPDEDANRAALATDSVKASISMVGFAFSRALGAGGGGVGRRRTDEGSDEWRLAWS